MYELDAIVLVMSDFPDFEVPLKYYLNLYLGFET